MRPAGASSGQRKKNNVILTDGQLENKQSPGQNPPQLLFSVIPNSAFLVLCSVQCLRLRDLRQTSTAGLNPVNPAAP